MTKLSRTEIIIAEQDKSETITLIAYLLQRLSKLYQLTNWTEENAIFLAEWIYDNYKYDVLDDVITCLRNPPHTENKQWRLTPDTINEWMKVVLTKRAEERESENKKLKENFKDKLDNIDYEAFKLKVETEGFPKESKHKKDSGYNNFKMEYLIKKQKEADEHGQKPDAANV